MSVNARACIFLDLLNFPQELTDVRAPLSLNNRHAGEILGSVVGGSTSVCSSADDSQCLCGRWSNLSAAVLITLSVLCSWWVQSVCSSADHSQCLCGRWSNLSAAVLITLSVSVVGGPICLQQC